MRAAVGRADLVLLIADLPPEGAARAAALLGFEAPVDRDVRVPPSVPSSAAADAELPPEQVTTVDMPAEPIKPPEDIAAKNEPVPMWRLEKMTIAEESGQLGAAPERAGGLTEDDLRSPGRSLLATPPVPPLAVWSRLWPVLREQLQASVPGRDPDVSKLVRSLARGEIVRRVPLVTRRAWPWRASVWVDRSARLVPFWSDQSDVCRRLRRVCGHSGLEVRLLDSRMRARSMARPIDLLAGFRPDPTVPVLVLGDLGAYGAPVERAAWLSTARRLRRAGVRVAALVTSPPARWDPDIAAAWAAEPWEQGRQRRGSTVRDDARFWEERARRLLRLAAPAALVQPGLLRALRLLLPAWQADTATEADAWIHADVRAADATGLVLHAEASKQLREQFAAEVSADLQLRVSATIGRWHGQLPKEILRAETLAWHVLVPGDIAPPGDLDDALAFARRLAESTRRSEGNPSLAAEVRRYGRMLVSSMPTAAYAAVPDLGIVWAAVFQGVDRVPVPPGVDPRALYAELRGEGEPRFWAVHQVSSRLTFTPVPSLGARPADEPSPDGPIAWLLAVRPHLFVRRPGESSQTQFLLDGELTIPLPPGADIELCTDRCEVTLKAPVTPADLPPLADPDALLPAAALKTFVTADLPPLADPDALVRAMARAHRRLTDDLQKRAADPRVGRVLHEAHFADKAQNRTGEPYEIYRDAFCEQVAASWVLCAVFARTLEDRGYLPHRLAGPGASDMFAQFRAQFRLLGERDYLLHIFNAIAMLPGGREVFGQGYAPLWQLGPTSRAVGELLDELRAMDGGMLRFSFGRPTGEEHDGASTRYLGDLYQYLNEGIRKRYALLQTPEFVERFLLDNTLDPAIRERGIAVTVLDPACGSGHMLLGAYDRLFKVRRRAEPGLPVDESARTALGQVYGVDLNPYAAAVARFRLLLSYLDKAGIPRLEQIPKAVHIQVYVGDSLLAGLGDIQRKIGDLFAQKGVVPETYGLTRSAFSFFDPEADKLLGSTQFDVIVANPPYIAEKDATKREYIRAKYKAAAGKYALSAPFVERIFQLGNEGAYTGQITANSFMKREFGKKLVEEVLPRFDLTKIIDTSGAYIPGHDTATVILLGRARRPVNSRVQVVMGIRGEPTTPEVPAEGKVWSSIAAHHDETTYANEYISVTDIERDKLTKHPWALGGGGAAELKTLLEERAEKRLGDIAESIGISSFTLEDDVYIAPRSVHRASGLRDSELRFLIEGDIVRDWACGEASSVVFPYDKSLHPMLTPSQARYLWPWKTTVSRNVLFGARTKVESGLNWFEFGRLTANKLRTPLTIVFAFVATHNHFVLDHGGKVFNRSAPIIKLPESATEEEHLALLAYLNSSTACFWMKQVFYPKGTTVHDVDADGGRPENNRYEFTGTGLADLPIHTRSFVRWGRVLSSLATERANLSLRACIADSTAALALRAELDSLVKRHDRLTRLMVAAQEEMDWDVYCAFSLVDSAEARVIQSADDEVWPDQRPFAWGSDAPSDLPDAIADRYRARRLIIDSNPSIRQIETAVYKRLWRGMQGIFGHNTASFRERQIDGLWSWLLDRVEAAFREAPDPRPLSVRALAHTLHQDPKVRAIAEVLTGIPSFDLESLLGDALAREAVAAANCQRYTNAGLEKRALWEKTWDLQRREDAGEKVAIDAPPKYDQKDFENAATVWRLRGKLDVPKERFIVYPTATPPPGAANTKAELVFGWAGWDHLQQLQAAIELWQEEIALHGQDLLPRATRKDREETLGVTADKDESLRRDAAARDKLMPILQTMIDLLPWVRQWHDEDGQTASDFEAYITEQAVRLEVSPDDARAYRRPARTGGRGGARKAAPAAEAPETAAAGATADRPRASRGQAPSDATLDAFVEAVRALDQGAGVAPVAAGEQLGLSAATLKKTVDALVESGRLVEKKKRPRLVSAA